MLRRIELPWSILIVAGVLLTLHAPVLGAQAAPDEPSRDGDETTWSFTWSDLGSGQDGGQLTGTVVSPESFERVRAPHPEAPPIVAAPLPPAIVPGLIGLAAVYAYKRRRTLR